MISLESQTEHQKKELKMEDFIELIKNFESPEAKRFWIMRLKASYIIKVQLLNKFNVYYK